MGFDQGSEVFVPMAMARGHRRADIEVVVGYQPVRCVYPTVRPFQHPYEAPSSGAGQDREIDVWCFTHAYTFPNRKVKSGVGKLREGSLSWHTVRILEHCTRVLHAHRSNEPSRLGRFLSNFLVMELHHNLMPTGIINLGMA